MRVLFVIGNLGDYHVPRFEAFLRLASTRGDEVFLVEIFGKSSVYSFPQDRRAQFFEKKAARFLTLINDASDAGGHWVKVTVGLFDVVRRFTPDVVVTLGYNTGYSIWLCVLKMLTRRFSLIYMSDSKADDGKRYAVKESLKRLLVRRFDGALVAGEKHRAYASSLGIPLARSRVGFDVIDVEYFSQLSSAAGASGSDVRARHGLPRRYVLCVSRFVRRKNVDLVIKAYFRSGLREADTSLVLVGQGPCGGRLRRQVAKLGLSDHVVILDSVKNGEMPGVYALAEFVVLASQFDQWGLCINEAFAARRPAIVTNTCGVADELVVDSVNGFIVEPGNVEMLADRIALLGTDLALRERFAHNAWSAARYWTPHLFASNLIDLSDSILRGSKHTLDPEERADSRA
jgi:glycosyltransferase involved in cell wall biosynthesis